MTHIVSNPSADTPFNRLLSFDAIGAALLAAILLVAVAMSSAEYARVSAEYAPDAVAAAFAGFR